MILFAASISTIPLWIVLGYLVLLLGLGIFSSTFFRGTSKDYFVASRSIGSFMLLMSVFGTTMTGFALVGSSGKAFNTGVATYGAVAAWSGIIHSAVFFIIGLRLWAIGKRHGYVTQVQFFRDRFNSQTLGTVLFVLLVLLIIPYLLIGIISAGKFVQGTTQGMIEGGIAPWITGLVICGVVLTYVFLGGVRSTAWANTFQTLVFMLTGIVAFLMISKAVAERSPEDAGSVLENIKRSTEYVQEHKPERLVRGKHPDVLRRFDTNTKYHADKPFVESWNTELENLAGTHDADGSLDLSQAEFDAMPADAKQTLAVILVEMVDEGDDHAENAKLRFPDYDGAEANLKTLHKTAVAKARESNDELMLQFIRQPKLDEPKPSMSHLVFITFLFIPLSIGMFPHVFQHWLTAKDAKTFRLAIVAHPICIAIVWLPCILIGVWAAGLAAAGDISISNPSEVLGTMVKLIANPWLLGLLMAGVLAAIMSSLDSQFACLGTMFTNDIVIPIRGKDYYSDSDKLKLARWFVVGVVAVAYLASLALMETASVFGLGIWCFTGFTALFPIVFAALYWKRVTAVGVYACMLVTTGLWVYWFHQSGYGADKHFYVMGMLPIAPLTFASAAALVVGSLCSKPPEGRLVNRFFPRSNNSNGSRRSNDRRSRQGS
jgi:SSS family solute:Na+ symporter